MNEIQAAAQWSKKCIRQFGYGIAHDFVRQVQTETLKWAAEQIETAESRDIARNRIMRKINDVAAMSNEKS